MHRLQELTKSLLAADGSPRAVIRQVEADLGAAFPDDLSAFLEVADAAEGFVGGAYLAIWPVGDLVDLNRIARIREVAPDLIVIATDGGGEGYALSRTTGTFVRVPMIGMSTVAPEPAGRSFLEFLTWLSDHSPDAPHALDDPRSTRGLVIHETHPVILGGSPTDPGNKALVPLRKYVELVAWWNDKIQAEFVDRSGRG